jgi:xanthine phosphoribosyltransferase
MQELKERILRDGKNMGGGILNVNNFLTHQVDPDLMVRIGEELARRFARFKPSKVLTAEISGIAPALQVGVTLGIPVVFARKIRSVTMPERLYIRNVPSHTKGHMTELIVAADFIGPGDRVLIIDDFLATGKTIEGLASIVAESGATLVGIGTVIEKTFEGGRENLLHWRIPIESLAIVERMEGDEITLV